MYNQFANEVERLGFGCEPLGGYNWGKVDINELQSCIYNVLKTASEQDKTFFFDTADTYGPYLSEIRLGEILKVNRERAFVATKFGVRLVDGQVVYDNSPSYIDQAIDGSSKRLGIDCIDLYQLHWHDGITRLEDVFEKLEILILEKRIKNYGACNIAPSEILRLKPSFPGLQTFSTSYSVLDRSIERYLEKFRQCEIQFIGYGCLAQGLLSGKYGINHDFGLNDRRSNKKYIEFHGERLEKNHRMIDKLNGLASKINIKLPQMALAYALSQNYSGITLVGIKNTSQWTMNQTALEIELNSSIINLIQEITYDLQNT